MEEKESNYLNKYSKDILLISECLHKGKIDENKIEEETIYEYCNKEKYFNKKGTKILKEDDYINITSILYEYIQIDDYIFPLFEKLNIYLIKAVINGYIYFSAINEKQKNKVYSIIKKLIPLMLNQDYVFFIYNKLSKIFRLHLRKNEEDKEKIITSFDKFCKIFEIWKLLFNYEGDMKSNEKYIQLFGKNNIIIKINQTDETYPSTKININFVKSPLFNINVNNQDFILIKIYTQKKYFELKLKDIIEDNESIYSIKFIIDNDTLSYIINNKEDKKEIKMEKINNKDITEIEIMKNFYGKLTRIEVIRKFKKNLVMFYSINPEKQDIIITKEIKKQTFEDEYKNYQEKFDSKDDIDISLEKHEFLYRKYYPKSIEFLNNIKYMGGFEAFLPIFKILQFYAKYVEDKNIIVFFTKNILEIIINKIHLSKENYLYFNEIIIPLTGALKIIIEELSEKEKDSLINNNIMNILYLYILISPVSKIVKDNFKEIINKSNENILPKIDYNDTIFEQGLSRINSLEWYGFILFVHFEINLLVYNDMNQLPKNILEQFSKIISLMNDKNKIFDSSEFKITFNFLICIIKYQYPLEIGGFEQFIKKENFTEYIEGAVDKIIDLSFMCLLILKISFELKNLNLIQNLDDAIVYERFNKLFLNLKNLIKIIKDDNKESKNRKRYLKKLFIEHLRNYPQNKDYILQILDEKEENIDFISNLDIKINQFIDYQNQFRKILKEQFLFNNFWSNKKLFFVSDEEESKLKYKQKNYYTNNFQRPIISPILDYKYQYPTFTKFKDEKDLYLTAENEDDYNFNLENETFDDILEQKWENNFEQIEKEKELENNNIIIYDACLIKQGHHIKGKILLEKKPKIKYFYFISYNYKCLDKAPRCNSDNTKTNLCYGAFFPCLEKDCSKKIKINIDDIRLIMKRIYFYRKSGIEIYTKNKSYYFNLAENPLMKNYKEKMAEKNCKEFFNIINESFHIKYYPITLNNDVLGYIDLFQEDYYNENEKREDNKDNKKKKFYYRIVRHWRDKDQEYSKSNKDISTFDLLILLNLISNRSYIDLYQYPIFPLLHFYDKKILKEKNSEASITSYDLIKRKLRKHIGFQAKTEKAKARKIGYKSLYKSNLEEYKRDQEGNELPYYFNTHYSNPIYVCNYILRIFPYSFISIECQGDGFDTPDRLFYSIETCYYLVSNLKSDIRELIPEFFYFPEMMFNINKLNFKKRSNGSIINNVSMPSEFNKLNKGENYAIFKYIEFLKNFLENKAKMHKIFDWIKIIFGTGQMYKENNKKGLLFRPESFIGFDDEKLNEYIKDKTIMSACDFGIIPLQTIQDELKVDKKKTCQKKYDKKEIDKKIINLKENKENLYIIKLTEEKNNLEFNKEYNFQDNKNTSIKIITNILGKVEIYLNEEKISENYDQKDIIKYIDYNKRLNMFITTSFDGYSCLYSFPNKLLNAIKHPNVNGYFDFILLGANPFPFIVSYDKINQEFYSYSINGIFITKKKIKELIQNQNVNEVIIYPIFDTNGGTHNDLLVINYGKNNNTVFNLPFFD